MKEIKEEAKRHKERKLEAYADGGRVHHKEHGDEKEDKKLIKDEVKPSALKHRAAGGPAIMGSPKPKAMGRGRKPGGKTNVNVVLAGKPGGDGAGPMPPVGGPGPLPPPRPAAAPMPPRPMPGGPAPGGPAGPLKRGGAAKHKHHSSKKHH